MVTVSPEYEIPALKSSPISTIDHVYSELKNALMSGEFSPGQPMRLEELAEAFGTSHMPIRESLSRLSGIGILERTPRRSTRVPIITTERLRDLLEVRLLNERQAVIWGAKRSARKKLTHISDINGRMDQLNLAKPADIKKYLKLNQLFHFAVYRLSENNVLINTIEDHWLRAGPVLALRKKGSSMAAGHRNHQDIIVKLEAGDGVAAADALERDIVGAHDQILAILRSRDGEDRAAPAA